MAGLGPLSFVEGYDLIAKAQIRSFSCVEGKQCAFITITSSDGSGWLQAYPRFVGIMHRWMKSIINLVPTASCVLIIILVVGANLAPQVAPHQR